MNFKILYRIVFLFLISGHLSAQNISLDDKPYKLKVGANYLSNYVYNGRSDSLKTPYFVPTISFTHKSGFFIDADFYTQSAGQDKGFAFLELNTGYEFSLTKQLSAGLYGTKYFYKGTAYSITGSIDAALGTNLCYNFGLFELNLGGDLLFEKGHHDVSFNPGVERKFVLGTDKHWSFYPSFDVNFSSLYYFEGFSSRKASRNAKKTTGATTQSIITVADPSMKLLDYELTLPLIYESDHWLISFEPTLAFPQNPIHTTTTNTRILANGTTKVLSEVDSTPFSERNLNSVFFAKVSLFIKIQ